MFQKLLGMVPHLADQLMECSNEESMSMADLVGLFYFSMPHDFLTFAQGSERRLRRSVR